MRKLIISSISLIIILTIIFLNLPKTQYLEDACDLICRQELIDRDIIASSKNSKYSLKKPRIIINPYEISELTSLIIFTTQESSEYEVFVNDTYLYTTSNTKNHTIPIYTLKPNFDNKIMLKNNEEEYFYTINPPFDKSITSKIHVKKSTKTSDYYFTSSSSSGLLYSAFDYLGNLIWHLNLNSQGSLTRLENGNFLVGVPEYTQNKNTVTSTGLYEINYLGKIIKRIDSKYHYHHETLTLNSNHILVAGDSQNNILPLSIVYKMNLNNAEISDFYDFSGIFIKNGANILELKQKYPYGMGINSIDYNKKNNELLISSRNMNMLIAIDYNNKNIKWVLGDKKDTPDFLKKYLLKVPPKFVYPKGQHQAKYYDSNTIAYYNNNYKDNFSNSILDSKNTSTATVFKINRQNLTLEVIKNYQNPEQKFSYALGGFDYQKSSRLVNYSYLYTDEAIQNKVNIFDFQHNTYSHIIEYDKQDKIVFDTTIKDRLYRVTKTSFPLITNYIPVKYQYFNNETSKHNLTSKSLKSSITNNEFLKIYQNHLTVNLAPEMINNLKIYFIGNENYTFTYNGTDIYYQLVPGEYRIYYTLNNKFYNIESKLLIERSNTYER